MMATAVLSIVVRVPESALSIARPQEVPAFTGSDIGTQPGSAATQVACYPVADLSATPVMITREALDGKASRRTISAERATAECRGLWAAGTFDEAGSSDAHVLFGGDQHPTARRPANPRIPPLQACPQTGGVIAVLPDAGRNSIEPCREPASRTER